MATFMPGAFCLSRCLQPQTLLHQRQSLLPPRRHCSPNACDTYAASSWKPLGGKRPGPGPARSNAERTPELGTGGEGEEEEEWEGLTEEEDWVVPGGANDSLSSNTELGRAVRAACDELDALGRLESDVQKQADELLRKLGYKGEPLMRPRPMGDEPVEEVQSADV